MSNNNTIFAVLNDIYSKPRVFGHYTTSDLWTDEYVSKQMLKFHLDGSVDLSSRKFYFIDQSVDWIFRTFSKNGQLHVLDFGCGPGLYAQRLSLKGAKVVGVDFSANSLRYAKEQAEQSGLEINYVQTNYLQYESTDKFDLVQMIMCDFCALSPEQRKVMLEKFHSLLKDDGAVLLDVYSLNAFDKREEQTSLEQVEKNGFWCPSLYYVLQKTFKYAEDKVTLDRYDIINESGSKTIYNWLQHFTKESIAEEFSSCGLKIESYLANVKGDEFDSAGDEFAIVARKA